MIKKMVNKVVKFHNVIIPFVVLLLVSFMTMGYAYYGKLLEFGGNVTLKPDGKLHITNIELINSSNVVSSETPVFIDNSIKFDLVFGGDNNDYYAVYSLNIVNESSYNYTYYDFTITPIITSSGGGEGSLSLNVDGISNGDIIYAGEVRTITMTLTLTVSDPNQQYGVTGDTDINVDQNEIGSVLANINPTNIDLTGDISSALVNLEIINTYKRDINFTLKSSNNNFIIVDASGNDLGSLTISANDTANYDIYIKRIDSAIFYNDTDSTSVILSLDGIGNIVAGKVTASVDVYIEPDTSIPEIGPITFAINNTVGQADVSWSRLDSGGSSITGYTILLYDASDDTLVNTYETGNDLTSYPITDISEGDYYVKVYGTDQALNSGASYVDSATTTSVYCRKSDTISLKWVFNITNNLSNLTSNGASTANLGDTYTATLSATGFYSLPSTIQVTMGGISLTVNTDYTYSSTTGAVSIPNVNGDIVITATATGVCLVEGTKIMLADGSYKNIEDIGYDDLLLVWNYEEGRFVYEYPIWIEKEHTTNVYQLTTFSDGTILKTIGYHGIYNTDLKRFVSVDNLDEFNIGTNVAIVNDNMSGFSSVSVSNIEYVYEKVKYYHVVSTRYYNVIANNLLTTDGTVILSNLYGFDDNIKWTSLRDEVIGNKDNLYDYSEFADIMPYYMFAGLRAAEGKYLANMGYLSKDLFRFYLQTNQLNSDMLMNPITNDVGKRMWKVSTDNSSSLIEEGTDYKLDYPSGDVSNFLYWYDMATGNKYDAFDTVKIWHGTHFEPVYK